VYSEYSILIICDPDVCESAHTVVSLVIPFFRLNKIKVAYNLICHEGFNVAQPDPWPLLQMSGTTYQ
jgi:hypothetical protein